MIETSITNLDDLLEDSNDSMDELFKEAFDSCEQCKRRLDVVSNPIPAAAVNNDRVLVTLGEGSREVRVH